MQLGFMAPGLVRENLKVRPPATFWQFMPQSQNFRVYQPPAHQIYDFLISAKCEWVPFYGAKGGVGWRLRFWLVMETLPLQIVIRCSAEEG